MRNAGSLLAVNSLKSEIAVFGRSGWLGDLARLVGIPYGSWLYGLQGILLAHLVLNAPLAARVLLAALSAISAEQWRLAAQLGMPPGAVFRFIDWPVLRREAPGFRLFEGGDAPESARVTLSDDTAWRLLFNALPPGRAEALVSRTGDPALSRPLLRARSVIV